MNQAERLDRNGGMIAAAKDIVARHTLPDFINAFDVKFGFSDDEPALFVLYRTAGDEDELFSPEWERRAQEYRHLDDAVLPELTEAFDRLALSFLVPEWRWDTFPD
ncbi:MAG TPA: hypothetical protein VGD75_03890 [Bradyrhizobium sp.]